MRKNEVMINKKSSMKLRPRLTAALSAQLSITAKPENHGDVNDLLRYINTTRLLCFVFAFSCRRQNHAGT